MDQKSIVDRINQIKAELSQLADSIRNLPANPNVEQLGNNCISIKSSELAKHDKWTPEFHDFEFQYNIIAELIEEYPIDGVLQKLDRIIKDGKIIHHNVYHQFHPKVIENLKRIIK